MKTMTYEIIRVQGAVTISSLINLQLLESPNNHGWLKFSGLVDEQVAFSELEAELYGSEISIVSIDEDGGAESPPIFSGFIVRILISEKSGLHQVDCEALTGTYKLDEGRKSRSFQDAEMTYADVVKQVLKDTPQSSAIFTVGLDKPIGKPVIQYDETDWSFIKRLASHLDSCVIADSRTPQARLWFGMREDGEQATFSENTYGVLISDQYYKMGGDQTKRRRSEFFAYIVETQDNVRIGDCTIFKEKSLMIVKKTACFIRGELIFTYQIGQKTFFAQRQWYNEKITGMTLLGNVKKTSNETVDIQLDIDQGRAAPTYPYDWVPTTGNMAYCMPQVGTRVSLYFPDHDERNAKVINTIRENGGTCKGTADPDYRQFCSEFGKTMQLFPAMLAFSATGEEKKPLQLQMKDDDIIHFQSHKYITMIAMNEITMESKSSSINLKSPKPATIAYTGKFVESAYGQLIPVGSAAQSPSEDPAPSISVEDSVIQIEDALNFDPATDIIFKGTTFTSYPPFADQPQKGVISIVSLAKNVCAGIASAGRAFGNMLSSGQGLGNAVKALFGGLAGVAGQMLHDIATGNVTDKQVYEDRGALAGAMITYANDPTDLESKSLIMGVNSKLLGLVDRKIIDPNDNEHWQRMSAYLFFDGVFKSDNNSFVGLATGTFFWDQEQGISYTIQNSFQRILGYSPGVDYMASSLGCEIGTQIVEFEYNGQLYRMQQWKGSYLSAAGCETGIYIHRKGDDRYLFQAVGDKDMLPMTVTLRDKDGVLFERSDTHFWVNGFKPGWYRQPDELTMETSIEFPNAEMAGAFYEALNASPSVHPKPESIGRNGNAVSWVWPAKDTEPIERTIKKYEEYVGEERTKEEQINNYVDFITGAIEEYGENGAPFYAYPTKDD